MEDEKRNDDRVVEPEVVRDARYREAYSEGALWDKCAGALKVVGREGLRCALLLYYVLKRPDLPGTARTIILGSLGYFNLPFDIIPDFIPLSGFMDDMGILAAGLSTVSAYVDENVKARADAKLAQWFGC